MDGILSIYPKRRRTNGPEFRSIDKADIANISELDKILMQKAIEVLPINTVLKVKCPIKTESKQKNLIPLNWKII